MSAAPFSATGVLSFPGAGRQAFILPPARRLQARRQIIISGHGYKQTCRATAPRECRRRQQRLLLA
uniref:Uncharacterized protein n=3 Tax=Enterobacteriaceae TaxID=543 RepID=A0A161ILH3_ECOLX|nr:conserved hypothetical protein [Klebsiella pneumoniae]ANC58580.1 hypothetical protein [Escherichia coli]ANC59633.1 hypothetical protein [Citrobacter freundii]AZM66459.1 hypothetical protein [Escherichia coli]